MRVTLYFHILAACLGLVSGFIALYAGKGATLHRKSGMVFVCVMLPMAVTGLLIGAVEDVAPAINVTDGVADVLAGDHVAQYGPADRHVPSA